MSLMTIASETLTNIANAIRAKTGKTAQMSPAEMVTEIESISTSGGEVWELHTITDIVLASSTSPSVLLSRYISKCIQWCYFPTSESPSLNSVARGSYYSTDSSNAGYETKNLLGDLGISVGNTAATSGVSVPNQFYVNDQNVSTTRLRGNINNIPAGTYTLKFYGIAR